MKDLNNLELILPLLEFETYDNFYVIQLLKRRKDKPNVGMRVGVRVVMSKVVCSCDALERMMPDLIETAKATNSRIVINLNKKSFKRCSFIMLKMLADQMESGQHTPYRLFEKAAGKCCAVGGKRWVIDIDDPEVDVHSIIVQIERAEPEGPKVMTTIPTPNGCHLITSGFNTMQIPKDTYSYIEIKRDNPTVLFVPAALRPEEK